MKDGRIIALYGSSSARACLPGDGRSMPWSFRSDPPAFISCAAGFVALCTSWIRCVQVTRRLVTGLFTCQSAAALAVAALSRLAASTMRGTLQVRTRRRRRPPWQQRPLCESPASAVPIHRRRGDRKVSCRHALSLLLLLLKLSFLTRHLHQLTVVIIGLVNEFFFWSRLYAVMGGQRYSKKRVV